VASLARRTTTPATLFLLLVSFAVILGCAVGSGELLELAERPNGSTAFDGSITSWMVAHRAPALTTLARVLSTVGSLPVLIPVAGIVAAVLLTRRRFVLGWSLVAACGGAILLYTITKLLVDRPRPPASIWLVHVSHTSSFPSGHATQSLATFLALALVAAAFVSHFRWALRLPSLIVAAGIGWSRVYLGVHWSTDVLAGWLIGAAWFTIVAWLATRQRTV